MRRPLKIAYDGRLWPNGEFGISRRREIFLCQSHETRPETESEEWSRLVHEVHGFKVAKEYADARRKIVATPGLSLVQNSSKAVRKGLKGISSYGKKMVRCAADRLQQKFGRKLLSFGTVTVPSVSSEENAVIASRWSEIVHLFLRDLKRLLEKRDLPSGFVSVTEIQEKRFARTGIPALHLHFVFVARGSCRVDWQVKAEDIRFLWKKQMVKMLGREADCRGCENVVGVKASASGYLGKYMSKGAEVCRELIKRGLSALLPCTWWNCSAVLKAAVILTTIRCPAAIEWLQSLCDDLTAKYFAFIRPVMIKRSDGSSYQMGWAGRIHSHWLPVIRNECLRLALDARGKIADKAHLLGSGV